MIKKPLIIVQPEDAEEAEEVADLLDEFGCEFVVLDKGVVTRRSDTHADGGSR